MGGTRIGVGGTLPASTTSWWSGRAWDRSCRVIVRAHGDAGSAYGNRGSKAQEGRLVDHVGGFFNHYHRMAA